MEAIGEEKTFPPFAIAAPFIHFVGMSRKSSKISKLRLFRLIGNAKRPAQERGN